MGIYARITTKCNMNCVHCGFACTELGNPSQGITMSEKTFIATCKLAANYKQTIDIGGGEPTLHPRFWRFIDIARSMRLRVYVATNGKWTSRALKLAQMGKKHLLRAELSQGPYHEPVSPKVVKEFGNSTWGEVGVGRKNYYEHSDFAPVGRAKNNPKIRTTNRCFCPGPIVNPNGDIWGCACWTKKLGTVFNTDLTGFVERCYNGLPT